MTRFNSHYNNEVDVKRQCFYNELALKGMDDE
jgi:hypothetical protein